MVRGDVTSPGTHPAPEWNELELRGERIRFVLLLCVVAAVVVARWAMS
jgi:hypothetical protein